MDINTFGKTPAAMYLVRFLNAIEDSTLNRAISRRITSTNNTVRDLINAYEFETLPTKTVANCLRLMREEIVNDTACHSFTDDSIVDQLRRNVQIGIIKRGLRLCAVSRKAERVMQNPEFRSSEREVVEVIGGFETRYKFRDSNSGKMYSAGMVFNSDGTEPLLDDGAVFIAHHKQSDVDDITSELLHERSNRRCLRQGKPHMIENGFEHPKG
jgi:hypothetical protein